MAEFNFFLNRQGIQGRKGEKGDTGFSPTISVGTDTLDEYKLIIANESNSFETPNLRGNINIQDNGGTYLRYDTETKQISAQSMDAATADTIGGVRLSTEADIVEMGAGSVVTPSDVADALPLYLEGEGAVTITQDELTSKTKIKVDVPSVNDLESRMSTAEAEIADIQTDVTNLNNNKVAKTDLATTESAGIVKVDGTSITVTEDGTISAVGGGGTGDVTASGNNVFTGDNKFKRNVTIDCDSSSGNALILRDSWADPYSNYATLRMDSNGDLTIDSAAGGLILDTYLHKSKIEMNKNGNIWFTSEKPLMHRNFQGSGTDVPLVNQENIKAGENITLNKNAETGDITISSTGGGGGTGDVPIATTEVAGKVKPDGTTITVTEDGTISANSSYTLPTASTTQLGGVKVDGTSVTINSDGVISAAGGGGGDVTAAGDNTFTGSNTFNSYVTFNNGFDTTNNAYLMGDTYVDNGSHYFNYSAGSLSMNMPIKCNNSYVLTQNALVAGDGITLANTSQGVQISASGGGSAPTNMVTTDTDQIITGAKTFTNSITFNNTLNMSTANTDTLYIHSSGSYAQGYTTDINVHKNLNIKTRLSGGAITLAPYGSGLNALKYKDSSNTSNPSYDILHTGNLVTGNNVTISKPNSTGVRTISGPSNEYIAHMAMPSDRYIELTLGASGATYTAPADGYFYLDKLKSNKVQYVALQNTKSSLGVWGNGNIQTDTGPIYTYLPAKKGDVVSAYYTASDNVRYFRFIYAEGSQPTT